MSRLLFWLLIAALVVAGLRKLGGARHPAGPAERPSEPMVRCRRCGLNLPQSEALRAGAGWACSPQHASDGPQSAPGP